jgi:hypothetical protein
MSKAGSVAALGVIWMVAAVIVSLVNPFNVPWWYNVLFLLIGLLLFLLAFPARRAESWWHQTFD